MIVFLFKQSKYKFHPTSAYQLVSFQLRNILLNLVLMTNNTTVYTFYGLTFQEKLTSLLSKINKIFTTGKLVTRLGKLKELSYVI